jgi:hypothetical protein
MRHGDDKASPSVRESEGTNLVVFFDLFAPVSKPLDENTPARWLKDDALKGPVWCDQFQAPPISGKSWKAAAMKSCKSYELLSGRTNSLG